MDAHHQGTGGVPQPSFAQGQAHEFRHGVDEDALHAQLHLVLVQHHIEEAHDIRVQQQPRHAPPADLVGAHDVRGASGLQLPLRAQLGVARDDGQRRVHLPGHEHHQHIVRIAGQGADEALGAAHAGLLQHMLVERIAVQDDFVLHARVGAALRLIRFHDDEGHARLLQLPGGLEAHLPQAAHDDVASNPFQALLHATLLEIALQIAFDDEGGEIRNRVGGHAQTQHQVEDGEKLGGRGDIPHLPEAHREQRGDGHVEGVQPPQPREPVVPGAPGDSHEGEQLERVGQALGGRSGAYAVSHRQPLRLGLMAKLAVAKPMSASPQVRRHSRTAELFESRTTMASADTGPSAGSR